jgi:signal transduction histidine kinase
MLDEKNTVEGIVVVAIEVTELTTARREAEAASLAKDEFIAMLSHELRSPLSPILTALQVMRLRNIDEAEREIAVIERQVRHMVSLIHDLLDVSRITKGKVELRKSRIELAGVVSSAIEMASPLLEARQHSLAVHVPQSGLSVEGDPERLAQVLSNLLTNAAKFTPPGGSIRLTGVRDREDVVLSVVDNGCGIDPEMLPRIFDLFAQARQDLDRSTGGLGLGLAIVKSLIGLHGGSVDVASE